LIGAGPDEEKRHGPSRGMEILLLDAFGKMHEPVER
jgi:hypothetical protein